MIEFKIKYPEMDPDFKDWTVFRTDWPTPNKVNFSVYDFRINDIVYEKYNEEFIKAFDCDIIWSKLKNEDSDEWLDAYMKRTEFERENATEILDKG